MWWMYVLELDKGILEKLSAWYVAFAPGAEVDDYSMSAAVYLGRLIEFFLVFLGPPGVTRGKYSKLKWHKA